MEAFKVWKQIKEKNMKYLEKNLTYKDKKKNVGARVSEVVLSALNNAEKDSNDLGYTFSITRIIDKALQDTLIELTEKTGMDYLALERFKFEMNERQDMRNIKSEDSNWIDFEKKVYEIKLIALNDSSVDMDLLLNEGEKNTMDYWDTFVINRKEEKVKTELEQLKESNQHLSVQMNNVEYERYKDYKDNGAFDRDMAYNDGWGKDYDKANNEGDKARQVAFDTYLKDNEDKIQQLKSIEIESRPGKKKTTRDTMNKLLSK